MPIANSPIRDATWFSREDVRKQLSALGYDNIPSDALEEFVNELRSMELNESEREEESFSTGYEGELERKCKYDGTPIYSKHTESSAAKQRSIGSETVVLKKRPFRGEERTGISTSKNNYSSVNRSIRNSRSPSRLKGQQNEFVNDVSDIASAYGSEYSGRNSTTLMSHRPVGSSTSFLRPPPAPRQTFKKSDPVAKYQQLQKGWKKQKPPGEQKRSALRWEVRENMMRYDGPSVEKPTRPVHTPNSYVVPTSKKRSDLVWNVREGML
eukprot:Nk52_evm51s1992 gene=Nk52_evmTU51s1992